MPAAFNCSQQNLHRPFELSLPASEASRSEAHLQRFLRVAGFVSNALAFSGRTGISALGL
jgi:hypothetical protein